MAGPREFWTEKRISRLERILQNHRGDVTAATFLSRLAECNTLNEKQRMIIEDLVPALHYEGAVKLWEGREIPTRIVLRDIIQEFLHDEGLTENVPTNEADTPNEAAEREQLARLLSAGQSAAEIVIEDRGPR